MRAIVRNIVVLWCALTAFRCNPDLHKTTSRFEGEKDNPTAEERAESIKGAEYYREDYLRNEDHAYKPYIKTAQLYKIGSELSTPTIRLNTTETVTLAFDDTEGDIKDYYYSLIHCNANWETSDLSEADYIDGYFQDFITDYQRSFNTKWQYTHYEVNLPNDNMKITKSGNYVLMVYLDNDPENVVLTRRFIVFEGILSFETTVRRPSRADDRNYRQEIDFKINAGAFNIPNPYSDLQVVIQQNNRWDNVCTGLKPLFVKDKVLIYDFDDANVFDGGNEFRYFDIRSLRFHSDRLLDIQTDSSGYQVLLKPDVKRTFKTYVSYSDLNGRYLVQVQEGNDNAVEADYAYVHFTLPLEEPEADGDFYLFGGFSDWQFKPEFKLKYNYDKKRYETNVLLKQGFYNYQYVLLKDKSKKGDETVIEGTHFTTENGYTLYAYFRDLTGNYDRLIGVHNFNSLDNQ